MKTKQQAKRKNEHNAPREKPCPVVICGGVMTGGEILCRGCWQRVPGPVKGDIMHSPKYSRDRQALVADAIRGVQTQLRVLAQAEGRE